MLPAMIMKSLVTEKMLFDLMVSSCLPLLGNVHVFVKDGLATQDAKKIAQELTHR